VTVEIITRAVQLGNLKRAVEVMEWYSTVPQMLIDKPGGWVSTGRLTNMQYYYTLSINFL